MIVILGGKSRPLRLSQNNGNVTKTLISGGAKAKFLGMYKWVDGGESRVKHLTPVVGISGKYARKIWMNCSVLVSS